MLRSMVRCKGFSFLQSSPITPRPLCYPQRRISQATLSISTLSIPSLNSAEDTEHVRQVAHKLHTKGILKVTLDFTDPESQYLQRLIDSLHKNHGHNLPITHSATRGWFWDVRPLPTGPKNDTKGKLARSETKERFPWHTDCSYEVYPPQYFALQVLHADQCSGGTLSILDVQRIIGSLSEGSRRALMKPMFNIQVPAEFIKQDSTRHIQDRLLAVDPVSGLFVIRLRDDIVTTSDPEAAQALRELQQVLGSESVTSQALHLPSETLPTNSIVLIDNRLWLHSRSEIKDPKRHLKRVRWNAKSFP